MSSAFSYVQPNESFMFGSATGTVDATYQPGWLVDGLASRPVRAAGGLSLTATALASRTVSLVAIVNHNISGSVAISGGVTATIPAATLGADGLYKNSFVSITPVSATSLVMAASGSPAIVGELIAGTKRTLQRTLQTRPTFEPGEPFAWEGEGGGLAPYDSGVVQRRLSGEVILSSTGLAQIETWYESTRRGTRPTLIIPNDAVNDPWLVTFRYRAVPTLIHPDPRRSIITVTLEFVEVPRVRW